MNAEYSMCVLVAKGSNKMKAGMELLDTMKAYCEGSQECRHATLLHYFGEQLPNKVCGNACDVCRGEVVPLAAWKAGRGSRRRQQGDGYDEVYGHEEEMHDGGDDGVDDHADDRKETSRHNQGVCGTHMSTARAFHKQQQSNKRPHAATTKASNQASGSRDQSGHTADGGHDSVWHRKVHKPAQGATCGGFMTAADMMRNAKPGAAAGGSGATAQPSMRVNAMVQKVAKQQAWKRQMKQQQQ